MTSSDGQVIDGNGSTHDSQNTECRGGRIPAQCMAVSLNGKGLVAHQNLPQWLIEHDIGGKYDRIFHIAASRIRNRLVQLIFSRYCIGPTMQVRA